MVWRERCRRLWSAALVATVVWLVGFPVVVGVVHVAGLDPLRARGALLPIAAGVVVGAILLAAHLRWRSELLVVLTAGFVAAWCALVLTAAYYGTPYGDSGLRGDAARIAAMTTRFATTWKPIDAFIPSIPTEYPPLYPWLIARVANLVGEPAWTLVGDAEVVVLSGAVLGAFLLWRRLVSSPVALALAVVAPMIFNQARKAHEIFVLALFLPWVLATFAGRPRPGGGMHWLPAGIIGAVFILTYQGFLVFSAIGLVGLVVHAWRTSPLRKAYLIHVGLTSLTALVVSSWYIIPYVYGLLFLPGNRTSNFFVSPSISDRALYLEFLDPTLPGALMLVGLVGLLIFRRTQWWAVPVLWVVVGALAYRAAFTVVFVLTGQTGYLDYTSRLLGTVLGCAGVLTLVTGVPILMRRIQVTPRRSLAVVAATVLLASAAFIVWQRWMPGPKGFKDVVWPEDLLVYNLATFAHAEPWPDGRYPTFAPAEPRVTWFPTDPILEAIDESWTSRARDPVVLSYDERLFVFRSLHGFVSVERLAANTFAQWDERFAELERLAALPGPEEFARESADTKFGPIDVFVLRETDDGWTWGDLVFDPELFGAHWTVHDDLPNGAVVAVRNQ
jgi:hypothetical protein